MVRVAHGVRQGRPRFLALCCFAQQVSRRDIIHPPAGHHLRLLSQKPSIGDLSFKVLDVIRFVQFDVPKRSHAAIQHIEVLLHRSSSAQNTRERGSAGTGPFLGRLLGESGREDPGFAAPWPPREASGYTGLANTPSLGPVGIFLGNTCSIVFYLGGCCFF